MRVPSRMRDAMAALSLQSKIALVVVDHAGVREMVSEIFESHKCLVLRAHDILDALALAATGVAFDLLVQAIAVPHAAGISLAVELMRRRPALKVLLITKRTAGTQFALAPRQNVRLLEQPFDPTELIQAAEQLFAGNPRILASEA
jgi:DNA-binding NtrC family response regulator